MSHERFNIPQIAIPIEIASEPYYVDPMASLVGLSLLSETGYLCFEKSQSPITSNNEFYEGLFERVSEQSGRSVIELPECKDIIFDQFGNPTTDTDYKGIGTNNPDEFLNLLDIPGNPKPEILGLVSGRWLLRSIHASETIRSFVIPTEWIVWAVELKEVINKSGKKVDIYDWKRSLRGMITKLGDEKYYIVKRRLPMARRILSLSTSDSGKLNDSLNLAINTINRITTLKNGGDIYSELR